MGLSNIRDKLIEFSSSLDYFAISSEDGKFILLSTVSERCIAVWKTDGGKK